MTNDRKRITLRVPRDLYDALQRAASEKCISVNALVNLILHQHFAEESENE